MNKINVLSPAKVNLYLKIIKKQPDNYHEINTIYQALSLEDNITLRIRKDDNIQIHTSSNRIPTDSSNLAFKAAKLTLSKTRQKQGIDIYIDKKIPVASGLGGGSSNAASVILGINKMFKLGLDQDQIFELADQLGSDVPFFALNLSTAEGRDRGQLLRKLENIPRYWFLLVCPDIKVSTKKVYEAYKQDLTKKKPGVKMIIRALRRSNMPEIGSVIYNDLEDTVKNMHKQVDQIKNHLKNEGVEAVLTSGSGPCIFGMFTLKEEAMRIAEKVQAEQKGWTLFTCCSRQNKLIV